VLFHVVRFSSQEPVVCGLVAGLRVINNDARIKHGQNQSKLRLKTRQIPLKSVVLNCEIVLYNTFTTLCYGRCNERITSSYEFAKQVQCLLLS
jgi:hypothetical protein